MYYVGTIQSRAETATGEDGWEASCKNSKRFHNILNNPISELQPKFQTDAFMQVHDCAKYLRICTKYLRTS